VAKSTQEAVAANNVGLDYLDPLPIQQGFVNASSAATADGAGSVATSEGDQQTVGYNSDLYNSSVTQSQQASAWGHAGEQAGERARGPALMWPPGGPPPAGAASQARRTRAALAEI
jgi:hypothetical protein